MQPHRMLFANLNDRRHRIDAGSRGRANRRHNTKREHAIALVFIDCFRERSRVHAKFTISRNLSQRALAQTKRNDSFVD